MLAIALATSCYAQKAQSVLWEISGKGLKQKSYLLGTIHILPHQNIDKFPVLARLMKTASAGIFENTGEEDSTPRAIAANDPPLDSVFNKRDYAIVDSFFAKAGYGSMKENNNNASLLNMIQFAMMIKETSDSDSHDLFDSYLQAAFVHAHKPCFQLCQM